MFHPAGHPRVYLGGGGAFSAGIWALWVEVWQRGFVFGDRGFRGARAQKGGGDPRGGHLEIPGGGGPQNVVGGGNRGSFVVPAWAGGAPSCFGFFAPVGPSRNFLPFGGGGLAELGGVASRCR